jgi:hypothetical protein
MSDVRTKVVQALTSFFRYVDTENWAEQDLELAERYADSLIKELRERGVYLNQARNDPSGRW